MSVHLEKECRKSWPSSAAWGNNRLDWANELWALQKWAFFFCPLWCWFRQGPNNRKANYVFLNWCPYDKLTKSIFWLFRKTNLFFCYFSIWGHHLFLAHDYHSLLVRRRASSWRERGETRRKRKKEFVFQNLFFWVSSFQTRINALIFSRKFDKVSAISSFRSYSSFHSLTGDIIWSCFIKEKTS